MFGTVYRNASFGTLTFNVWFAILSCKCVAYWIDSPQNISSTPALLSIAQALSINERIVCSTGLFDWGVYAEEIVSQITNFPILFIRREVLRRYQYVPAFVSVSSFVRCTLYSRIYARRAPFRLPINGPVHISEVQRQGSENIFYLRKWPFAWATHVGMNRDIRGAFY